MITLEIWHLCGFLESTVFLLNLLDDILVGIVNF